MQNKLNIAILIPGHLRWWKDCKENFLKNFYNNHHQIDVYVDTYKSVFRTDYFLYDEKDRNIFLSDNEIKKLFDDINVVSFNIDTDDTKSGQIEKLQNVHKTLKKTHKKYDLVVRTRFDIMLEEKINYDKIYEECKKNEKLIFIGSRSGDDLYNDMFAICLPETFQIYAERFKHGDVDWNEGIHHGSLKKIMEKENITYNMDTCLYIKRHENLIQKYGE